MNQKGSLIVEALISLVIIAMAVGIGMLPTFYILKKTEENAALIDLSEVLLNECEEKVFSNVSNIAEENKEIIYKGRKYRIVVTKTNVEEGGKYRIEKHSDKLFINDVTFVTVRVVEEKSGRYIEAQVVPQQW